MSTINQMGSANGYCCMPSLLWTPKNYNYKGKYKLIAFKIVLTQLDGGVHTIAITILSVMSDNIGITTRAN